MGMAGGMGGGFGGGRGGGMGMGMGGGMGGFFGGNPGVPGGHSRSSTRRRHRAFPAAVMSAQTARRVLSPRHLAAQPVPHPLTFPDRTTIPYDSIPSKRYDYGYYST